MMELITDLVLGLTVVIAIYGYGRTVRRFIRMHFWSHSAELAYTLAFGLGLTATVLFGLSLVGLLVMSAGWVLLVIGIALGVAQWKLLAESLAGFWNLVRSIRAGSWFVRLAVTAGIAFAVLNLVVDLAPPFEGDTVHQYLLLPRYWIEAGRYVQTPHIWAATLPGNMMMISAWALLLNGSYSLAGLVTGFAMSLFYGLSVYAFARKYFNSSVAVLAGVAAYTMPDVGYLAMSAKVDMGWIFFETLALASFWSWLDNTRSSLPGDRPGGHSGGWQWLALSGVMLGLAAGSKNQTLISIALLGGWLVIRMLLRGDWQGLLRSGFVFGAAGVAAMMPFYLYNAVVHANPLFPVFAGITSSVFGGTISPRSELGTEIFYPWTVGGYISNLWNASLGHTAPGFYLGFIAGPVFLLAVPVGLMLKLFDGQAFLWRNIRYAMFFSVVWFFVKQAARHFLPGLTLLAIAAGFVLWRLDQQRGLARSLVLVMALGVLGGNILQSVGVMVWNGSYRVALGAETRTEFLERWHNEEMPDTFPDWETLNVLNEQIDPESRILSLHATNPLYVVPDFIPANWGERERFDIITDQSVLVDMLKRQGIDYILLYGSDDNEAFLFASSAFLSDYGELVYDGDRTQLYRLINLERDH